MSCVSYSLSSFVRPCRGLLSFVSGLFLATVAHATIGAALQMQLGNPSSATTNPNNHTHYLIQRDQYALDYDDVTREPNWVSWDLTSDDVGSSGRSNFIQDTTLPAGFYQVLTTDYSGSGYDRGHMCPSADRTVTVADNQQVFYMSNMVPQAPDNNQGVWANFESYCRSLASAGNEVLITCGPSGFGGSTIASGVAIPGYTWKIAVVVPLGPGSALSRVTSSTRVIAIKVPNIAGVRSTPWQDFLTSVAQIEADTGYAFFTALPSSVANALRVEVDGQSAVGAPSITAQPVNQTTVIGGSATFSVTATGDAPLTYQWLKDDVEIPGATSASLIVAPVQASDAGNYDVVVTNGVGSATSNSAALIIGGLPPSITTPPDSLTVNAGGSATFTVVASGSPTLFYQWRKNTNPIASGTNATLTLTNVQATDVGNYDVVVTNSVSSATSAAAALTVNPAAPTITTQPAPQASVTGGGATFSVVASGTAPLSYQWRKGGSPLSNSATVSGATTATLTLTNVAAIDVGNYDVVVTNPISTTTSNAAALTVTAPPPSSINWNFGTTTALATPSSGLPSDITGGTMTQGNNNGTTTLLTNASTSSGYTGASGTFNAGAAARIGALNQGASGSAYFEFTLTPVAGKRLTASGISFGMRSTGTGPQAWAVYTSVDNFAASVASGTIANDSSWHLFTPTFTTVTGTTSTAITFRIYGYNGAGSPAAGTANWRMDDLKLTAATVFPPPVAPVVTATSPANGATNVDVATPITVTFNEAVSFTGSWFSISSASNGTTAAAVTGGPTTFTITPPSNFSYTDTITVTIFGAQVVDQASGTIHGTTDTTFSFTTGVFVPPTPPSVTAQPASQTINVGDGANFTVAATGTAPLSYQWRHNTAPISGNASATTATLSLTNVTTVDAGSYDCVVSNIAGSDVSHAATLTVNIVPPTITSQPASQMTAFGGTANFSVGVSGTAPFSYQWRKNGAPLSNGGAVSGVNSATLTLTGVTTNEDGNYDVVVTNAANSATSNAATLAVSAAAPSVIYWDFGAATPTSGIPANVTGGAVSQGNNNGTTTLLTTTSASGSYTGASGGNNAGAAARIGALNQSSGGSAYFEFTFTPASGRQFAATAISFGMRSTSTGPQAFALFSSLDGFASPLATGAVPNDAAWHLYTPSFSGVVGAAGAPVTFRLFGYNGAGGASANTANWRIDDLKLTAGILALPPTAPVVASTSPAAGATNIALNAPISVTFDQAVNVAGSWFTIHGSSSGAIAASASGGPTTFILAPSTALAYGETVTTTIVAAQVKEQATNTLSMASNYSFSFTTIPPTPPSITTPPTSQTATVGDNVTFTVAATGTAPLGYQWRKAGAPIAGASDATLTLNGITTAAAADYDVVVLNIAGSATSTTATLTVNKAAATVTLSGLGHVYTGAPQGAVASTTPGGLGVDFTYNGSPVTPTNAGSYAVVATINDANYTGSNTGTLVIAPAPATVTLGNLAQIYSGAPKSASATTAPVGLSVGFTFDGNATAPTNAGSYAVVGSITNPNYVGAASGTLVIAKATAGIAFSNLAPTYDGTPKAATVTTTPAGLSTTVTYDGSSTSPTNAGSYTVAGTVCDANYTGFASATLVIAKATAPVTLGNLKQAYDGTPKPTTITTSPTGLTVNVTYDGSVTAPTNPGAYLVSASIVDDNYTGSASGTLLIAITALVRHAPTLDGGLDGSLQMLSSEDVTLNGNAWVAGDVLVPGTPALRLNGSATVAGVHEGTGSAEPANYQVTLNGRAVLRYLVRRTDPVELPVVAAPPAPVGTRSVNVNTASQSVGDCATLRDLTLNGNAGSVAVPPGTYGNLTANSRTTLVLGVIGATSPSVYNLQSLTLNGGSILDIVGPIVINLARGATFNGATAPTANPDWLTLNIASGGLTLNNDATLAGFVTAPAGTVSLNGSSTLVGGVAADRLVINGNAVLREP
jgi:DNA/RNA endonuclease G (NUC1)